MQWQVPKFSFWKKKNFDNEDKKLANFIAAENNL
jgi:hypothetical protein